MIIRAARPGEFGWIVERTGLEITTQTRAAVAVEGSRILAMVAADGWTPNAVRVHIAVESPIALRYLLREVAVWLFVEAKRSIALGIIADDNPRSLRLAKRVGFREVYRVKDGWAKGVDLVALELRREWCRWHHEPARKVAA